MNSPDQALARQHGQHPALQGVWISNNVTLSLPFENASVDSNNVMYISMVLESSAARQFSGVDLTIWTQDEPHSQDLRIDSIDQDYALPIDPAAIPAPAMSPTTPVRNHANRSESSATSQKPTCPVHLQLSASDTSDMVSPCHLDILAGDLPPLTRILWQGTVYLQPDSHGRVLFGYFLCTRQFYRVFSDPLDGMQSLINHLSGRVMYPDPTRAEMPQLAPELIEEIFSNCCVRSCDWPGCRIHAKMNLWLLAQVSFTWLTVARRMHWQRQGASKKLVESATSFDFRSQAVLPPALKDVSDPRLYFSLATIMDGQAMKAFHGVKLAISMYGSDIPTGLPETVEYLGLDGAGPDPEQDKEPAVNYNTMLFPVHLRLDTWNASEEITGAQVGSTEASWSSRQIFSRTFLFRNNTVPSHLGWFKSPKPIWLDRDTNAPTLFSLRVRVPEIGRRPFKPLPLPIVEKIMLASSTHQQHEDAWINTNEPGWPALTPKPDYVWTCDLKRYGAVCKSWATVAKKIYKFQNTLSEITGYTHASCYSFGGSVKSPNHYFAAAVVFEGKSATRFTGADLTICVPEDSAWSNVDVTYVGDHWNGHEIVQTSTLAAPRRNKDQCETDVPICPISLCLSTSEDDSDSYHVAISQFPGTRPLCRKRLALEPGSALSAIPCHVVRIALPEPKRKRMTKLPDNVVSQIVRGLTELSDSKERTSAWRENLKEAGAINRQFRRHILALTEELMPPLFSDSQA